MSVAGKNKAVIAPELRENLCTQVPGAHFSAQVYKVSASTVLTNSGHWIDLYPLDSAIGVPNTYMLDGDFFVHW